MSLTAFNQGEWSMVDSGRLGVTYSTCFLTKQWFDSFERLFKNQLMRYLTKRLKKLSVTEPSDVGVDILVWLQNEAANDLKSKFADASSSSSWLSRLLPPLTQVEWMLRCMDKWVGAKSTDADDIKSEVLEHAMDIVWTEAEALLLQMFSIFYKVKATTVKDLETAARSKIYAAISTAPWKAGAIKKLLNSAKIEASDFLLAWVRSVLFAHGATHIGVLEAIFTAVCFKPVKLRRPFDAETFEHDAIRACVDKNKNKTEIYEVKDVQHYIRGGIRDELQTYIDEASAPSVSEIHEAHWEAKFNALETSMNAKLKAVKAEARAEAIAAVQSNPPPPAAQQQRIQPRVRRVNNAPQQCKCGGRFVHDPHRHACPLYLCWGCGKYSPGHGWPACPNPLPARTYHTGIDVNTSWSKDATPTDQQILASGYAASPQ
jgi:hypothetical protein